MTTSRTLRILLAASLTSLPAVAGADTACPTKVTDATKKAFPGATMNKCKAEKEDGHDQFEVKLTKKDGARVEVDVSPDGKILQIEEVIAIDKLPAAVAKAFAAKYPKAKPTKAEKQTRTGDKLASFEIAFKTDKGKKEATFSEDGKFVEEE